MAKTFVDKAIIGSFGNEQYQIPHANFIQIIEIDNKDIQNSLASGSANINQISSHIEKALARRLGFAGTATDISEKADLQQFSGALTVPQTYQPGTSKYDALVSLIGAFQASAQGEEYESDPSVREAGGPFAIERQATEGRAAAISSGGGLGFEVKLSGSALDLTKEASRRGVKGFERGQKETTIAQRAISRLETVQGESSALDKINAARAEKGLQSLLVDDWLLQGNTDALTPATAALFRNVGRKMKNLITHSVMMTKQGTSGKKRRDFILVLQGLIPTRQDIRAEGPPTAERLAKYGPGGSKEGESPPSFSLRYNFSNTFQRKVENYILSAFEDASLTQLSKGAQKAGIAVLKLDDAMPKELFTDLNVTKSIAVPIKINLKVKSVARKRKKGARKQTPPGRFISNVQFSALLQNKLAAKMPRYPEPHRPTPRYITGRLARSFQIMANYRQGIIGFYNTPPAAGYVDELNENGWMLDETLVEPTIRQITQQLFGRQFRVLRTQ